MAAAPCANDVWQPPAAPRGVTQLVYDSLSHCTQACRYGAVTRIGPLLVHTGAVRGICADEIHLRWTSTMTMSTILLEVVLPLCLRSDVDVHYYDANWIEMSEEQLHVKLLLRRLELAAEVEQCILCNTCAPCAACEPYD